MILLLLFDYSTSAKDVSGISLEVSSRSRGAVQKQDSLLTFKERWSIKTNAFEWLMTIPNLSTEFDLSRKHDNKMTLGLGVKYNWPTWHKYAPSCVFNLFDVRPQFRYYWRSSSRLEPLHYPKPRRQKFLEYVVDHERENPKHWRANYVGAYVNYSSYALKFGKTGVQGKAVGLGATLGYSIPLYTYKKGCIDLDLGMSFGFQMTSYDRFRHDKDGYYYVRIDGGEKPWHFTPFPLVSELSMAFAYRFKSVKDKYPYNEAEKKLRQNKRADDYEEYKVRMQMTRAELQQHVAEYELEEKRKAMTEEELEKFDAKLAAAEARKAEKEVKEKAALEERISRMSQSEKELYQFEQQTEDQALSRRNAAERRHVDEKYKTWQLKESRRVARAAHRHQLQVLKDEVALAKKVGDRSSYIETKNAYAAKVKEENLHMEEQERDFKQRLDKIAEEQKSADLHDKKVGKDRRLKESVARNGYRLDIRNEQIDSLMIRRDRRFYDACEKNSEYQSKELNGELKSEIALLESFWKEPLLKETNKAARKLMRGQKKVYRRAAVRERKLNRSMKKAQEKARSKTKKSHN